MGLDSYIRAKLRGTDKKIGNTVDGAAKCFKASRSKDVHDQVILDDVLTRMRMTPPQGMTGWTGRDYYLKFMLPLKSLLGGSQTSVVVTVADKPDKVPHRKKEEQKRRDSTRMETKEEDGPASIPYPDDADFSDQGIQWKCTDGTTIHTEPFNINKVLSGRRTVRVRLFKYLAKTFE
jgi:hypothetical protein